MELEYGNFLLIGDVFEEADSFDHAFGRHQVKFLTLKNFSVICYNLGSEHDITKCFNEKELDFYKELLLEKAKEFYAA